VLNHVYGQQPSSKSIEWRHKSEENSYKSRVEARELPEPETVWSTFVQASPSAGIEHTSQQPWSQQPGIEIPGTEDRI